MLGINQWDVGYGLFLSYTFWVAFGAVAIISLAVKQVPARLKHWLFILANALFLLYFTQIGLTQLGILLAVFFILFIAAKRIMVSGSRSNGIFFFCLAVIVLFWVTGKVAVAQESKVLSGLFFIGESYILIKIWSLFKDARDGYVKDINLGTFLNYCTFFPCFLSGPMHYYNEFTQTFNKPLPLNRKEFIHNLYRILLGLVKVRVLAVALRPYSLGIIQDSSLAATPVWDLFLRGMVYSFVLYFDFSGYCDVAIGTSGMLKVYVPENFRLFPYLAPDIRNFWQRWHITFTRFITNYIFIPFTRGAQRKFRVKAGVSLVVAGYLITFVFVGFWHGSTLNFLLWGIYHGIGLSLYDIYRRICPFKVPVKQRWAKTGFQVISILLTFIFVSIGWILFVLPVKFFI